MTSLSRAWNQAERVRVVREIRLMIASAVRLRTFVEDWQQFGHVLDKFLQADEEWCVRSIARVLSDDCDPRFSDGCAPVSTP